MSKGEQSEFAFSPAGTRARLEMPTEDIALANANFRMGVYLRRQAMGEEFYPRYVALLRDTGRMTAEQLAATHLDVRLDDVEFWRATIGALEPKVARFEALVDELVG